MIANLFMVVVALVIALVAYDAYAQAITMEGGGPFDLKLVATYGWIVLISLLGGLASFYSKVKKGQARWCNLGEIVGELATSALAGLLTFWLCRATGINEWVTAAFVGIGGHMGSRALFLLEKFLERWLNAFNMASRVPVPPAEDAVRDGDPSIKG